MRGEFSFRIIKRLSVAWNKEIPLRIILDICSTNWVDNTLTIPLPIGLLSQDVLEDILDLKVTLAYKDDLTDVTHLYGIDWIQNKLLIKDKLQSQSESGSGYPRCIAFSVVDSVTKELEPIYLRDTFFRTVGTVQEQSEYAYYLQFILPLLKEMHPIHNYIKKLKSIGGCFENEEQFEREYQEYRNSKA